MTSQLLSNLPLSAFIKKCASTHDWELCKFSTKDFICIKCDTLLIGYYECATEDITGKLYITYTITDILSCNEIIFKSIIE